MKFENTGYFRSILSNDPYFEFVFLVLFFGITGPCINMYDTYVRLGW